MFKWSDSDKIVLPLTLLVLIVIAVILRLILLKKEKLKAIPLKVVALFLVALEIAKQIYFIFINGYDLYALPLHFCTLIMVMIVCAQFLPEKISKYFKAPALIYSIFVLILLLVNPNAIIGSASKDLFKSFHNVHTFLFHFSLVAYFIFSVALNDFKPTFKDIIPITLAVVFYSTYAIPLAFKLNVNYVNILKSYFEPLEKLRLSLGQFAYDTTLFLITILAGCVILLIYMGIYKLFEKHNKKQQ